MNKVYTIVFFQLLVFFGLAQLPETDVWLFELDNKTPQTVTKGKNITARPGYDNQPSFSSDGKRIYYTTIKEDKQADVFEYSVSSQKTRQITRTAESEYSPSESPVKDLLSTVTVLKDSSQIIQLLAIPSYTPSSSVLSSVDSVGYYNFLNADTVLYYKLTEPHSLRFHVISSGADGFICSSPCRTFKTVNRHSFVYGIKDSASTTYYIYETLLQRAKPYASYQGVHEDMFWHDQWGLLISDGTKVMRYNQKDAAWQLLFDFSSFGIQKITRFCIDKRNRFIALVNNL